MRLLFVPSVFVLVPITAQVLTLPPTSAGAPGETIDVKISYAAASAKAASLQWETIVPAQLMEFDSRDLEVGPAAREAGKNLSCNHPKPYISFCVLSGGTGPIPNGPVALLSFKIKAAPEKHHSWIRLGKVEGTTQDGEKLTISDASGALTVTDQPAPPRPAAAEAPRNDDKGKEIREAVLDAFKEIIREAQSKETQSTTTARSGNQPPVQQASVRPAKPTPVQPVEEARVQPRRVQPTKPAPPSVPAPAVSPGSVSTADLEEIGRTALRDHKYKEAFDALNQALQQNPNSSRAYNARGFTYYMVRAYDAALKDLDKAISLDPKYQNAYHNRSIVRRAAGDLKGAGEDEAQANSLASAQPAQTAAKK
jgi:tetratricopeptide (TPR) repeat protein